MSFFDDLQMSVPDVVLNKHSHFSENGDGEGDFYDRNTPKAEDKKAPSAKLARSGKGNVGPKGETITVTLSEGSTNFGLDDLDIAGGTASEFKKTGDKTYTFLFTPGANSQTVATIGVRKDTFKDASGNKNKASPVLSVPVDTTAPTLTLGADSYVLGGDESRLITITSSKDITGLDLKDFTSSHGTFSNLKGSGRSYTVEFTPAKDYTGWAGISIKAGQVKDSVGNGNKDSNVLEVPVDTTAPTVKIAPSTIILGADEFATLTLTFSKEPKGWAIGDIKVTGLLLSGFSKSKTNPLEYTVTIKADGSNAAATLSIAAGVFKDALGNGNLGNQLEGLLVLSTLTAAQIGQLSDKQVALLTASHLESKDASHTVAADLLKDKVKKVSLTAIKGSAIGVLHQLGLDNLSPAQRANLSNAAVGELRPEEGYKLYKDLLPVGKVQYLTTAVVPLFGIDELRADEHALMNALSHAQRGNFSAAVVHEFTPEEVRMTAHGHRVYEDLTPELDCELNASVVRDLKVAELLSPGTDGKPLLQKITSKQTRQLAGGELAQFEYDNFKEKNADGETVEQAQASPLGVINGLESVKLTFIFKNPPEELGEADLVMYNLDGSGNTDAGHFTDFTKVDATHYSGIFWPNPNNPATQIRVGFTTESGAELRSITVDTVAPTAAITVDDRFLGVGQTARVIVEFSEAVKSFTIADIEAKGGTVRDLRRINESGTRFELTFTPDAKSWVEGKISIKAGAFKDKAGNANLAAHSETLYVDTLLPTVSIHSDNFTLREGHTVAHLTITLSDSIPGARDPWMARNYLAQALTSENGTFSNFRRAMNDEKEIIYLADFTLSASADSAPVTEISINVAANLITDGYVGNEATTLKLSANTRALFLESTDSGLGVSIDGTAQGDHFGAALDSGDVNGDGFKDWIVSAPDAADGAGKTYVLFGDGTTMTRSPSAFDLAALEAGTGQGFVINGAKAGDHSGFAAAALGDVDGDGLDDVGIGAPDADNGAGAAYVVFGKKSGTAVNLAELAQPAKGEKPLGYVIQGAAGQHLGSSVGALGDLDGDKHADLAIGTRAETSSLRHLIDSDSETEELRFGGEEEIDSNADTDTEIESSWHLDEEWDEEDLGARLEFLQAAYMARNGGRPMERPQKFALLDALEVWHLDMVVTVSLARWQHDHGRQVPAELGNMFRTEFEVTVQSYLDFSWGRNPDIRTAEMMLEGLVLQRDHWVQYWEGALDGYLGTIDRQRTEWAVDQWKGQRAIRAEFFVSPTEFTYDQLTTDQRPRMPSEEAMADFQKTMDAWRMQAMAQLSLEDEWHDAHVGEVLPSQQGLQQWRGMKDFSHSLFNAYLSCLPPNSRLGISEGLWLHDQWQDAHRTQATPTQMQSERWLTWLMTVNDIWVGLGLTSTAQIGELYSFAEFNGLPMEREDVLLTWMTENWLQEKWAQSAWQTANPRQSLPTNDVLRLWAKMSGLQPLAPEALQNWQWTHWQAAHPGARLPTSGELQEWQLEQQNHELAWSDEVQKALIQDAEQYQALYLKPPSLMELEDYEAEESARPTQWNNVAMWREARQQDIDEDLLNEDKLPSIEQVEEWQAGNPNQHLPQTVAEMRSWLNNQRINNNWCILSGEDDVVVLGQMQQQQGRNSSVRQLPADSSNGVYFLEGKADGDTVNVSNLGKRGLEIDGGPSHDLSGAKEVGVGDVNNSGYKDVLIGAQNAADGAGKSYVLFGEELSLSSKRGTVPVLSEIAEGKGGFVIIGEKAGDHSGASIADAGDVNGDGYADVIISAPDADGGVGSSYVVFGKATTQAVELSKIALGTGQEGFKIKGEKAGDQSGFVVSGVGDINDDGYDDVFIGAPGANGDAGRSYVVFGKADGKVVELSKVAQGVGGFIYDGEKAGDRSGSSVAAAYNVDGYVDIVIGAPGADPAASLTDAGSAYLTLVGPQYQGDKVKLMLGDAVVTLASALKEKDKLSASLTLSATDDLRISYQWLADGKIISGVNGDSLILTAAQVGKRISVTASYTYDNGPGSQAQSLYSLATQAVASIATNRQVGTVGPDVLTATVGADLLEGRAGNDLYTVNHSGDRVLENRNAGEDTVKSFLLDYTLPENVENLILVGSGNINGTGNTLDNVLTGNGGKNVLRGEAGHDTLDGGAGNDTLIGGTGSDHYLFGRGYGIDTVQENDATPGNIDQLEFGSGIAANQIWLRKAGNNLELSLIGTTDKVIVNNWYLGEQYHVERLKTADGKMLLDSQVRNLVDAMANFPLPAVAGQTTLPTSMKSLEQVIAANWQ